MVPVTGRFAGRAIGEAPVTWRARREPLCERTRIEGEGATRPFLSPGDGFAERFTRDVGSPGLSATGADAMLAGETAREAPKRGRPLGARTGTSASGVARPRATDSHTGLATAGEDGGFGRHAGDGPPAVRLRPEFVRTGKCRIFARQTVAPGPTGGRAGESRREAILDAGARKEVSATTGPRMAVRFSGVRGARARTRTR